MSNPSRPLSPHLQIYKPQLTSVLSILHRFTGLVLVIALGGLTIWLYALAESPAIFDVMQNWFNNWFGSICMFGVIFSFWYHMGNGIRHLIWDTGRNLDIKGLYASGYFVLFFTGTLSLLSYIMLWLV